MKKSPKRPLASDRIFNQLLDASSDKRKIRLKKIKEYCDYLETNSKPITQKDVSELCEQNGVMKYASMRNDRPLAEYIKNRANEQSISVVVKNPAKKKVADLEYYGDDDQARQIIKALKANISVLSERAATKHKECETLRKFIYDNVEGSVEALEQGKKLTLKNSGSEDQKLRQLLRPLLDDKKLEQLNWKYDAKGNLCTVRKKIVLTAEQVSAIRGNIALHET